jgi:outer membrane protein assembly factor BamB
VLIIRHTFSDGRTFLSFYGHLDPPSVVLRVGDCVARGDKVGEIGDPRTPPHLHFEIRTHMPNEPGPGYWAEDPTLAGWLPPSQTIWESRIVALPGVGWIRPAAAAGTRGLGILAGSTYAVLEDDQLIGLQVTDGRQSWRISGENRVEAALVDEAQALIYTANSPGQIAAYQLTGSEGGSITETISEPLWSLDLEGFGFPILMPFPGGGLVLARNNKLLAFSPEGEMLWEMDEITRPFDWLLAGDRLIFSTVGGDSSLWAVGEAEPVSWQIKSGGRLAGLGDQLWFYGVDGLYQLDLPTVSAELVYELPQSLLSMGDIMALPDGGILVDHRDRADRRLIVLEPDGSVRWQRSYAGLVEGNLRLLLLDEAVFVVAIQEGNGTGEVAIYALDLEEAALTHLFTGGTRLSLPEFTQVLPAGQDRLLINIGGGSMALLNPQAALEAVSPALTAR